MESCVIQLTNAAHKHGNLNIRPCGTDFFPPNVFGSSSEKNELGVPIVLLVKGLSNPVETDIPKDKKTGKPRWFFRKRKWVKDFVRCHKLHANDRIIIKRLSKRMYEIEPWNNSVKKKSILQNEKISSKSELDRTHKKLRDSSKRSDRSRKGQFLTSTTIAHFMAGLFEQNIQDVRMLDAGAGAGVLFASSVEALISRECCPKSIEVVAYENDKRLLPHLENSVKHCETACKKAGIAFLGEARTEDFLEASKILTEDELFSKKKKLFTHAILNPPYKKINGQSITRKLLDSEGIKVSNLYAAFVWLAVKMLVPKGELVIITPRSFCNGPYFRKFRLALLSMMAIQRIHVFKSRKKAFANDGVLQENVILYAIRGVRKPKHVTISSSEGLDFYNMDVRYVPYENVILPNDKDAFIHLILDDNDGNVMSQMQRFGTTLYELGLEVSTGRVVDFRATEYLRQQPENGAMPLVYPCHFHNGFVHWPVKSCKKPNAILSLESTRDLMVMAGYYVLTKRFSAKEEKRRVVAAIYDPQSIQSPFVGFENHLNYFHAGGKGLSSNLAKGLAMYLNSTLFDRYFRLFSGHTQVNATDLKKMRYPTRKQLIKLGGYVKDRMPDQNAVDAIMEKV